MAKLKQILTILGAISFLAGCSLDSLSNCVDNCNSKREECFIIVGATSFSPAPANTPHSAYPEIVAETEPNDLWTNSGSFSSSPLSSPNGMSGVIASDTDVDLFRSSLVNGRISQISGDATCTLYRGDGSCGYPYPDNSCLVVVGVLTTTPITYDPYISDSISSWLAYIKCTGVTGNTYSIEAIENPSTGLSVNMNGMMMCSQSNTRCINSCKSK